MVRFRPLCESRKRAYLVEPTQEIPLVPFAHGLYCALIGGAGLLSLFPKYSNVKISESFLRVLLANRSNRFLADPSDQGPESRFAPTLDCHAYGRIHR